MGVIHRAYPARKGGWGTRKRRDPDTLEIIEEPHYYPGHLTPQKGPCHIAKRAKAPVFSNDPAEVTCKWCSGEAKPGENSGGPRDSYAPSPEERLALVLGMIRPTDDGWSDEQLDLARSLVRAIDTDNASERQALYCIEKLLKRIAVI